MRVLGVTITRQKPPPQGAIGSASPYSIALQDIYSGGPDINPMLSGRNKFPVYNEMRHTNPAVRSSLWMLKLTNRAASWDFDPISKDPLDMLVADACRWQFGLGDEEGQLDLSWDEQLGQALLMLDWGANHEEDVWAAEPATWIDKDGDEHTLWPLARCSQRSPETIDYIKTNPLTGQIDYLHQWIPGTDPIPGRKLTSYVLDREGDSWWGTSLLRPMWAPWVLQKALMTQTGMTWGDRFGHKVPVLHVPQGQKANGEDMMTRYRRNELGGFVFEGVAGIPGSYALELFGPDQPGDPVGLLRWYSEQIAVASLQQFSSLGGSQHGSRAVGDVLVEPFTRACETIAKQIAQAKHRGAIRRFVDQNFGTQVPAPRLTASKIQMRGLDVLASAISDLSAAGLEFTDLDTQNDIRSELSLPQLEKLPPQVGVAPAGLGSEGGLSQGDQAALDASRRGQQGS
jgi:hypothetical protein